MKVWALFSIENQYDQPENNLEKLYMRKPTFEQLIKKLYGSINISELEESQLVDAVMLLKGERVRSGDFEYRIEEVEVHE